MAEEVLSEGLGRVGHTAAAATHPASTAPSSVATLELVKGGGGPTRPGGGRREGMKPDPTRGPRAVGARATSAQTCAAPADRRKPFALASLICVQFRKSLLLDVIDALGASQAFLSDAASPLAAMQPLPHTHNPSSHLASMPTSSQPLVPSSTNSSPKPVSPPPPPAPDGSGADAGWWGGRSALSASPPPVTHPAAARRGGLGGGLGRVVRCVVREDGWV